MPTVKMRTQLGYYIRRAQQQNVVLWSRFVSEEITSRQFAALNCLRHEADVDQKKLGHIVSMDRSTTAELTSRMTKRGLIKTVRDPSDFRRRVLILTTEGSATLDLLVPKVVALDKIMGQPLTEGEHDDLISLLRKLVDGLDQLETDGARAQASKSDAPRARRQSSPRSA